MEDLNKARELMEWLKVILFAVMIALLLKGFVFTVSIVEGESMEPALKTGERVIFNKVIYLIDEPQRNDIVFIKRPDKNYVKRIVGLPEETIEVVQGELYINGERTSQSFLNDQDKVLTGNMRPLTIPKNKYFVMGDNRAISKDSRNGLGFVHKSEIIGRSEMIIYPFNEIELTK
ncbi:MAG TPA: signal peptidase I [Pseudogracilibacillus sp.]|nr:signal peptidase I [Pseudogracilibacillus sp.]